jgi:hypothetical protein
MSTGQRDLNPLSKYVNHEGHEGHEGKSASKKKLFLSLKIRVNPWLKKQLVDFGG